MHILLTRPKLSAEATAIKLRALGHVVEVVPVLDIVTLPQQISEQACGAVVFTSQNAVLALEELAPGWLSGFKGSVFAVGLKTAKAIENKGVLNVFVGGGEVAGLAEYIAKTMGENRPSMYFPRGRHVKGDLEADLKQRGFEVVSQTIYEASPASFIPDDIVSDLLSGKFERVLFYSSRTATIFIKLAQAAGVERLQNTVVVALSAAIANDLKVITWAEIRVATEKSEESLISML